MADTTFKSTKGMNDAQMMKLTKAQLIANLNAARKAIRAEKEKLAKIERWTAKHGPECINHMAK